MSETSALNKNNNANNIEAKNTSIYNIRKTDKGLYFNIKSAGENGLDIKDLFIPSKFYYEAPIEVNLKAKNLGKKNINKVAEYGIIYPGAIISLSFIIITIIKNLDKLASLLGLYY